jgi:hypothetical protein
MMETEALHRLTDWFRENGFTANAHGWFERSNVRVDIDSFSNTVKLYVFTDKHKASMDWGALVDGNAPTSAITHLIESGLNDSVGV